MFAGKMINGMKLRAVLICFIVTYTGVTCDYSEEVKAFFNNYFPGNNPCKTDASNESRSYTGNTASSVAMVNLYTQDCTKYEGSNGMEFYRQLNSELRNANGTLPKGNIWGTATYLLSKALDTLPQNNETDLYRGCRCPIPNPGDMFSFTSFASTSTDPQTADDFLGNSYSPGSFFSLKHMSGNGVPVANYSAIPSEAEVLLDKLFHFDVTHVERDAKAFDEVKKIYPQASNKPAAFVQLRPLNGRRRRSTGKLVLCKCNLADNHRATSDGHGLRVDAIVVLYFASLRLF